MQKNNFAYIFTCLSFPVIKAIPIKTYPYILNFKFTKNIFFV